MNVALAIIGGFEIEKRAEQNSIPPGGLEPAIFGLEVRRLVH